MSESGLSITYHTVFSPGGSELGSASSVATTSTFAATATAGREGQGAASSHTGPFPPMQHSASVLARQDGRLLAVWYAASYETADDSVVLGSTFDGDQGWSEPAVMVQVAGFSLGNPVLWQPPAGPLRMFLALLPEPAWTSARVASLTSADGGSSWHELTFLHGAAGLMTKGNPLEQAGRWLLPTYDERTFAPMVLLSDDAGSRWTLVGETTARGRAIQPVLATIPGGLLMLCRSTVGRVLRSYSFDGGSSWTASQPTALPNPNSGIASLRLRDGRLCLIYNPSADGRTTLALATSNDHGTSWTEPATIQEARGEVSYPCVCQDHTGIVHVLYTLERLSIMHAAFAVPWG